MRKSRLLANEEGPDIAVAESFQLRRRRFGKVTNAINIFFPYLVRYFKVLCRQTVPPEFCYGSCRERK